MAGPHQHPAASDGVTLLSPHQQEVLAKVSQSAGATSEHQPRAGQGTA